MISSLTAFFGWCIVLNGSILVLWAGVLFLIPDLAYRTQKSFVSISKEDFGRIFYFLIGLYKVLFIVFNVAPYIALKILQK